MKRSLFHMRDMQAFIQCHARNRLGVAYVFGLRRHVWYCNISVHRAFRLYRYGNKTSH